MESIGFDKSESNHLPISFFSVSSIHSIVYILPVIKFCWYAFRHITLPKTKQHQQQKQKKIKIKMMNRKCNVIALYSMDMDMDIKHKTYIDCVFSLVWLRWYYLQR